MTGVNIVEVIENLGVFSIIIYNQRRVNGEPFIDTENQLTGY